MNKRDEFIKKKDKDNGGHYLSPDKKLEYLERMIVPYQKNGTTNYFLKQYLDADGNELRKKFWATNSSSRFAFEMYSWLAKENRVKNITFEEKLVGIANSPRNPNMDVYIELDNKDIFIESKLTEKYPQNLKSLSISYYSDDKDAQIRRYRNHEDAANEFKIFIVSFVNRTQKDLSPCWFDFKQEITHLVGLYLTIVSDVKYKNKEIEFYNVYYDFGDTLNEVVKDFFEEAQKMMNRLLVEKKKCLSFKYDCCSAQDFVKKQILPFNPEQSAFGIKKPIEKILEEQFDFIF